MSGPCSSPSPTPTGFSGIWTREPRSVDERAPVVGRKFRASGQKPSVAPACGILDSNPGATRLQGRLRAVQCLCVSPNSPPTVAVGTAVPLLSRSKGAPAGCRPLGREFERIDAQGTDRAACPSARPVTNRLNLDVTKLETALHATRCLTEGDDPPRSSFPPNAGRRPVGRSRLQADGL